MAAQVVVRIVLGGESVPGAAVGLGVGVDELVLGSADGDGLGGEVGLGGGGGVVVVVDEERRAGRGGLWGEEKGGKR